MSITLEHVPAPERSASASAAPTAPRTAPARTGLLAMLGEAVAAARLVSTADPRTSVLVAQRFAARINA